MLGMFFSCVPEPICRSSPFYSNPDNNFRFSSTVGSSGGYIFNLGTAGLTTGTYNLNFTVGNSPQTYSVPKVAIVAPCVRVLELQA